MFFLFQSYRNLLTLFFVFFTFLNQHVLLRKHDRCNISFFSFRIGKDSFLIDKKHDSFCQRINDNNFEHAGFLVFSLDFPVYFPSESFHDPYLFFIMLIIPLIFYKLWDIIGIDKKYNGIYIVFTPFFIGFPFLIWFHIYAFIGMFFIDLDPHDTGSLYLIQCNIAVLLVGCACVIVPCCIFLCDVKWLPKNENRKGIIYHLSYIPIYIMPFGISYLYFLGFILECFF